MGTRNGKGNLSAAEGQPPQALRASGEPAHSPRTSWIKDVHPLLPARRESGHRAPDRLLDRGRLAVVTAGALLPEKAQ